VLSVIVTLIPIILSAFRLPGNIVLGGSNSKVISAACHCIPLASSDIQPALSSTAVGSGTDSSDRNLAVTESLMVTEDGTVDSFSECTDADRLQVMATRKLKWGEVTREDSTDNVGHLAFGVEEQGVIQPVEGRLYL
jgi:hypothetical protein